MPSSNQTTDTNNNSKNKITNGRSEVVVVSRGPSSLASTGGNIGSVITTAALLSSQINTTSTTAQIAVGAQQARQTSFIPSIKLDQQQQHPHINNNNNNSINVINNVNSSKNNSSINNNNNNNITQQQHRVSSSRSQQVAQQQQQQQQQAQQQQSQTQLQQPPCRDIAELTQLIKDFNFDRTSLTNEELIKLVKNQQVSVYKLESFLGKDNAARCVEVRRDFYRLELAELDKVDPIGITDRSEAFNGSNYEDLEFEKVNGACCENVIGHVKVPVGVAGPLVLDGEEIFVPLATTEGCLVASTCRGLSALRKSGGVSSRVRKDFMTRAPIIRFHDQKLRDALENVERAIAWLNDKHNKEKMRTAFNFTSSHGKFINYTMYPVNREIHIRFEAQTGDAMGMNMCSKGVESALKEMQRSFPTMEIVTLSGNMCTDKKAAGINWINGRGKSVECNAELPAHVVQQVFKVSVDSMIDRWKSKVMVGSALAASIGGFNSQAANILTAIFIATGQDPAQNVTSSNCMLILEKDFKGSLVVCCTMPSIECGTVGGGTILGDQSRYLQMMGVKGPTPKIALQPLTTISEQSVGENQLTTLRQQEAVNENENPNNNNNNNSILNGDGYPPQAGGGGGGLYINNNNNNNNSSSHNTATMIPIKSTSSSPSSSPPTARSSHLASQIPINSTNGYTNARKLARIICATVMAGELSLLAALTEGTLVKSHMRHNRSSTNVTATTLAGDGNSCFGANLFNNNNLICSKFTSSLSSSSSNLPQSSGGGDVGDAGGGGGVGGTGINSVC